MGACGVIHTYVAKMGRGKRMELIEIDVANVTQSKNGTFLDTSHDHFIVSWPTNNGFILALASCHKI